MANYTKKFTKPYTNGYKDRPDTSTPVTANIKNAETDALLAIEEYLAQNNITPVSIDGLLNNGYSIAIVEIDGETYDLNIPELSYESAITGGTKIGQITLGEKSYDLYAPTASTGSNVSVTPKVTSGTNIAEITVDGTTYQLYAPTGGGSGSTVTAEATLTEGTQIGKITIDGIETILYAPMASTITVDGELSATSENAIQNKAVDAAVKNLQQQIDAGGTGGSVTVDSALSTTSVNPVQNKVITAELNKKIETLEDESQAPDTVNFDLDSELSLTSTKGVQNKAIAEEFQKYANGTKVAAKATEAETAKTAASATTAQSATTAESATKATQDAQGNVIDTTYAKKTEIPQGAVVDDALSSTSVNPVQNKIVKKALDKMEEEVKKIGTSVPNMTNNTNGIGRPDKTTITVNEQGVFSIFENTDGIEYVVNNDFHLSTITPIIQIGKIAIAIFDMACNSAIHNTNDIMLLSFTDSRNTGDSIKPRISSTQGFCCTASKGGLSGDNETVLLPCKLVYERKNDDNIVSLYICRSEVNTEIDLSDYSYISGSVMWVTE